MNRFLARTSVIALCAAWSLAGAGLSAAYADNAPAQPAASNDPAMPSTLQGQIARAKALRASGDLKEAAHSLAQILLVAPDDIRVVGEYGKVLAQQGYAKDAVAFLSHAVQLQGADWSLYSALGVAYDQLDDHVNARKAYDRALAMSPGQPTVINNYAVSRMLVGDYQGAAQMLAQLQASGAADPKIAANLAKAQELKPASVVAVSKPATVVPASQAPAVVASTSANIGAPTVVMQKVPVDPLAGPVGKHHAVASNTPPVKSSVAIAQQKPANAQPAMATGAPHALVSPTAKISVAATPAKVNPATTIMQKVPVDPKAGPVARPVLRAAATSMPAKDAPKKSAPVKAAAKAVPPPTLRTAASE